MSNEIYDYEPLWGSWKIDALVGKGSIGKVYRISKSVMNKKYISAVKFITVPTEEQYDNLKYSNDEYDNVDTEEYFSDVIENIIKEVDLLYKLKGHTNIVNYEDHIVKKVENSHKWNVLIKMEYAKSLKDYLKRNKIDEDEIVKIALDICEALIKCHSIGILHRDIKEANIFRTEYGDYKLGDFSVSRHSAEVTYDQTRVGTVNYMPPEIMHGQLYDKSADLYSLGIVLYKLMNKGRFPFIPNHPEKFTLIDVENAQVRRMSGEKLPKPVEANDKFSKIILKACSFKAADRYQSSDEMKAVLTDLSKIMSRKKSQIAYDNDREAIIIENIREYGTTSSLNEKNKYIIMDKINKTPSIMVDRKMKLKKISKLFIVLCLVAVFVGVLCLKKMWQY